MFETLIQYPRVLARHREGPAADERQRFLIHQAKEGAARGTLLRTARELLVIAKKINITSGKLIDKHDIEEAAVKWARQQQPSPSGQNREGSVPMRSCPAAQSTPAGLDRVLRAICPIGTVPFAAVRQSDARSLGDAKVQALSRP
jgi:hypothetical protein